MTSTFPGGSETVFTYGAPLLKFGTGASDEIGYDLSQYGARRVLVVTDPRIAATGLAARVADQMQRFGIEAHVYDGVHVEPTDASLQQAIDHATEHGPWDAYVAVGGGSSIDTAKAVNLLHQPRRADGLHQQAGRPGPGAQQAAQPAGCRAHHHRHGGREHHHLRARRARPEGQDRHQPPAAAATLAVVDPALTVTQPAGVTAASGMDILCHALESYTAKPYTAYDRKQPEQRVPYCGSNPISDMWSENAMRLLAGSFRDAVRDGDDLEARGRMALAATMAGLGFGNAGVHIPHANAYPIAGRVKDFRPDGYPEDEPIVPHGMAVSLTAPEAFRFTFEARPERHLRAAELLAPGLDRPGDDAEYLPAALTLIMRDVGIPNGIGGVGYDEGDIGAWSRAP